MGRHFEVRAAAMAASAKKKSAVYMRASKEIYMAAKGGVPDPSANLALRSAIEKYKKVCPKDVIDRAIQKAKGGSQENYIAGRYEAFGPGGSFIIVDTLTDNTNRALTEVRNAITKKGGHLGSVAYNFSEYGVIVFKTDKTKEYLEELLILSDVDLTEISIEEGVAELLVAPTALAKAKEVLASNGTVDLEECSIQMIANEKLDLSDEDKTKFQEMLDMLDEVEDVQEVYHNVNL